MKKRAKIITTIASLCLAVALMAFGVYAATQVTLSVASTVSFEITDVFVDIQGKVFLGATQVGDTYNYSSYETTDGGKQAKGANDATRTVTEDAELEWTADDIEYASDDTVSTWVLKISNVGTTNVVVSTTGLTLKAIEGTYRDATYIVWDATAGSGAGAYASAARFTGHTSAETTYTAGDWTFANTFTVIPGKYVEITFTRTLEDLATALDEVTSVTGTVSVSMPD